jgi:hypothetical protein
MTAIAAAVNARQWELVSLRLLIGVSKAAALLPPESLTALVEVLGGAPEKEARGHGR